MKRMTTDGLSPNMEGYRLCSWDGGSSEPAGQTTVQNTREPWAEQKPYLETGFARAGELLDTPTEYYPTDTVVPFAPETEQALDAQTQRALAGSPLLQAAQGEAGKVLGGEYLNADNPAFGAMAERISNQVRPGIDSQFATQGRYGGGGHEEMYARTMADALAPLQWQNYAAERGNMQDAMKTAPELAREDYYDIGQLSQVGGQREALARDQTASDIDRWNFEQFEPQDRHARYMAAIAGGQYGGSSTTNTPYYNNRSPLTSALGAASSLASIYGNLTG